MSAMSKVIEKHIKNGILLAMIPNTVNSIMVSQRYTHLYATLLIPVFWLSVITFTFTELNEIVF